MTDLGGIAFYMTVAYLAGDLMGWTLVRLVHRAVRRDRP